MKTTLTLATLGLTASIASAALVAQKTYDGGDFGFADGAMHNKFDSSESWIDGANSLALFDSGSYANYNTVDTYNTTGQVVTVNFKFCTSDEFNVTSATADGVDNLLGFALKDAAGADILLFKFAEGTDSILLNDGGSDFARSDISFSPFATYSFSVTMEIGSNKYSYSINSNSGPEQDSGNDFTLSSGAVGSFGQVSFFMNGPGGPEEAFVDSITVDVTPVPEPSSSALLALGGLAMAFRRRK